MFRILGFLVGSATSIIIILLIVGMPEFHLEDEAIDKQRYDAAIEKLKEKQHEIEAVTGKLKEDVARVAESVEDNIETIADKVAENLPEQLPPVPAGESPAVPVTQPDVSESQEQLWFSFWNPFRSEIAAKGFVSQLERVTGIDYRIVKVKTGVYEVAFAYNDDVERRTKLSQISAATGLDLPDS